MQLWRAPQQLLVVVLVAAMLTSTLQGLFGMEVLFRDTYQQSVAKRLVEHTSPKDRLLVVEGGWGGHSLFLSGRSGLSIWNTAFLENKDNLKRLQSLGFNKLVLFSESPLLAALQQNNPGNESYKRKTYEHALSESSRQWTTVYQDEDMAIKELP
jgi:hypothetical protein